MSNITEGQLDINPEFNTSIANNPYIENLSNGSIFGASNLPIVKTVRTEVVNDAAPKIVTIKHNLKKRYDLFARYSIKGEIRWYTIPFFETPVIAGPTSGIFIDDIRENEIDLEIDYGTGLGQTYIIELFFVDFFL